MLLLILSWIVFGAIAGWITALMIRTENNYKPSANVVAGIVGALMGGFLLKNLQVSPDISGFSIISLVSAVIGAIVLIAVVKGFNRV